MIRAIYQQQDRFIEVTTCIASVTQLLPESSVAVPHIWLFTGHTNHWHIRSVLHYITLQCCVNQLLLTYLNRLRHTGSLYFLAETVAEPFG